MSNSMERVLVVPSEIRRNERFNFVGFTESDHCRTEVLLDAIDDHYWFHTRSEAEGDVSLLQIIPYVLITRPGPNGKEYFAYQRTTGGGDKRLHGAASFGLGGHVNPCDATTNLVNGILVNNIRRELDEEVDIFDSAGNDVDVYGIKTDKFKMIGEIYSDDSLVSTVHYGTVYELALDAGSEVAIRETHKMRDLGWYSCDEMEYLAETHEVESWSSLIMDSLTNNDSNRTA